MRKENLPTSHLEYEIYEGYFNLYERLGSNPRLKIMIQVAYSGGLYKSLARAIYSAYHWENVPMWRGFDSLKIAKEIGHDEKTLEAYCYPQEREIDIGGRIFSFDKKEK